MAIKLSDIKKEIQPEMQSYKHYGENAIIVMWLNGGARIEFPIKEIVSYATLYHMQEHLKKGLAEAVKNTLDIFEVK